MEALCQVILRPVRKRLNINISKMELTSETLPF